MADERNSKELVLRLVHRQFGRHLYDEERGAVFDRAWESVTGGENPVAAVKAAVAEEERELTRRHAELEDADHLWALRLLSLLPDEKRAAVGTEIARTMRRGTTAGTAMGTKSRQPKAAVIGALLAHGMPRERYKEMIGDLQDDGSTQIDE